MWDAADSEWIYAGDLTVRWITVVKSKRRTLGQLGTVGKPSLHLGF
jgi:hypothetical protein